MDVDESFKHEELKHKCYVCHIEFETKDSFKKHKKCKKFLSNRCDRSEEECWYVQESQEQSSPHKSKSPGSKRSQVFCEASKDPFPPEQLQQMYLSIYLSIYISTYV